MDEGGRGVPRTHTGQYLESTDLESIPGVRTMNPDDFQNSTETSVFQDTRQVKFSQRSNHFFQEI